MSGDLIDTTEMYLKTILELEEDGIVPMRARITERLGHSGPTVSQTVARMERDGLVELGEDRHLVLTDLGRLRATRVMRKHRLAERLLTDVIGLELPSVHDEACRWEHVMSEDVERRLVTIVQPPYVDPYGNPVPGLAELGGNDQRGGGGVAVGRLSLGEKPVVGTVVRIGEPAQVGTELLTDLQERGLLPGRPVTVRRHSGVLTVRGEEGDELVADPLVENHLFISA